MYYRTKKKFNKYTGEMEWYYVYFYTDKRIYLRHNTSLSIASIGLYADYKRNQIISTISCQVTKEEFEGDCSKRDMNSYRLYKRTVRKVRLSNEYRHYSQAVIRLSRR